MAVITVRAIDPATFDPFQGNGQENFIADLQAVVQIINTRLRLFQGEWFLNLLDGLSMFQSILGSPGSARNLQVIINLISQRIQQTPHVINVSNIKASYQNRRFAFAAKVTTEFGTINVTNSPGSTASLTAQT